MLLKRVRDCGRSFSCFEIATDEGSDFFAIVCGTQHFFLPAEVDTEFGCAVAFVCGQEHMIALACPVMVHRVTDAVRFNEPNTIESKISHMEIMRSIFSSNLRIIDTDRKGSLEQFPSVTIVRMWVTINNDAHHSTSCQTGASLLNRSKNCCIYINEP